MAKKSTIDMYTQVMSAEGAISAAATTGTINKLDTAYNTKDKIGLVVQRIEWYLQNIDADYSNADLSRWGLSFLSVQPSGGFEPEDAGLIDYNQVECIRFGAGGADFFHYPIVKDYSNLLGGGVLCHPAHMYFWTYNETALAAGIVVFMRMYYHKIDLNDDDYRDLWEAIVVTQTL